VHGRLLVSGDQYKLYGLNHTVDKGRVKGAIVISLHRSGWCGGTTALHGQVVSLLRGCEGVWKRSMRNSLIDWYLRTDKFVSLLAQAVKRARRKGTGHAHACHSSIAPAAPRS